MFRGFDAPDIEAKESLRAFSLTSFHLPDYLDGVKCTIAHSVSRADAGSTRTGDDVKMNKALLEVRCPYARNG